MAQLKDADRRLLWGRSGNMCAYPKCGAPLTECFGIEASGTAVDMAVGEEAHIVSEADAGPRADPSMPKSERNSYPNLILLCLKHHKLVDRDNGAHFTVEQLNEMKGQHEARVSELLFGPEARTGRLREEYLDELQINSRVRLIARWAAAGLDDELSGDLADDVSVGAWPLVLIPPRATGVVVLEGDFGSGKSVAAERLHQGDIAAAVASASAPLPVYLSAEDVPGTLRQAVLEATEPLGKPMRFGVRVILDGLDEVDTGRAHRLLAEAHGLAQGWPDSCILVTARPGLEVRDEDRIAYPPLDDQEAHQLARRIGGQHVWLHSESEAVRAALRLPLFIIIAVTAEDFKSSETVVAL